EVRAVDEKEWPIPDLSPRWRALIRRLWAPDGKSIVGFLPEIIATIKSTNRSPMAEHGLLMVLHSPKVRSGKLVLQGPANTTPGYQAMKRYCDAAGLPPGKVREAVIAAVNAASREVA